MERSNMKNPAAIQRPRLSSPIGGKRKNGKGNALYIRTRRRMRRSMFR